MLAATSNTIAAWALVVSAISLAVSTTYTIVTQRGVRAADRSARAADQSAAAADRSAVAAERSAASSEQVAAIEAERRAEERTRSAEAQEAADKQRAYDVTHPIDIAYETPFIVVRNRLNERVRIDEMWFEPAEFVPLDQPNVGPAAHEGRIRLFLNPNEVIELRTIDVAERPDAVKISYGVLVGSTSHLHTHLLRW